MRERSTLDWSQSKIFLVCLLSQAPIFSIRLHYFSILCFSVFVPSKVLISVSLTWFQFGHIMRRIKINAY